MRRGAEWGIDCTRPSFSLRRELHFVFVRGAQGDVVELELAIERGAADAEHSAGEGFIAAGFFEDAEDGHALEIGQGGGGEGGGVAVGRAAILRSADGGRQIFDIYHVMIAEGYGAGYTIFQFADVAGPFVLQETFHGRGSDLNIFSGGVAVEEIMR